MNNIKRVFAFVLALFTAVSLSACGGEKKIGNLVVGTTMTIENAKKGDYNFDMITTGTSQLPVVSMDANGVYHPSFASWETSDSITWKFTVTEGLKWSDGSDASANDILEALKKEDSLNGSYVSAEVSEDKKSITIVLKEANVRFLSNMAVLRPIPSFLESGAEDSLWSGPFVFDAYDSAAGTLSFSPNENYPGIDNLKIEKLIFKLFSNEDTMYLALKNEEIQMAWNYSAGVSVDYQKALEGSETIQFLSVEATNVPAVLAFNNAKGFFADKNLRLAVSYALNYDTLKSYLGSSLSKTPNRGFVPATTFGYKETEALSCDIAKADEYMQAAGYTKSGKYYVNTDGKDAEFTLTVASVKTVHISAAELVKNMLEEFGIKVNIEALDTDAYNEKTANKYATNGISMEAAIYGYTINGMAMQGGLGSIYVDARHTVQGGAQVYDKVFANYVDALIGAKTPDEYKTAAASVQDYYASECPVIALYWDNQVLAASSDISDLTVDANFGLNNVSNWFSLNLK